MVSDPVPTDPDEYARQLARDGLTGGSPTAWFERLYADSRQGRAVVPWDRGQPHPLLVEWAERSPRRGDGARALVVGSGPGHDAEYVSYLGFATTAFDVSPTAVAAARSRFPGSAVDYTTADLLALPAEWASAFALVVEIFTVQSLPRTVRRAATASVSGTVAPGGTLLVVAAVAGADPAETEREPGPPWPLTAAELAELDKLSALPAEYPGWMLAFQGVYRDGQVSERRVAK